jgi:hypothetical protein
MGNEKFCEELIAYDHGPHRKRPIQYFFYRFVCIRCRGNVSTGPLPLGRIYWAVP